MYINNLIKKFAEERNIKNSTMKGYESALNSYSSFHKLSIEKLLNEAFVDENNGLIMKNRKIKSRLLEYRQYLLNNNFSSYTIKTYFCRVKSFYLFYDVELPYLPPIKYEKQYVTNYDDLPTKKDIKLALDNVSLDFASLILFMSSSGTAKAETLSLTINDFLKATKEYYNSKNIKDILDELELKKEVIPTFYLKRKKTNKYYYTFCSPEATTMIVKYLKSRINLKLEDKLFLFTDSQVIEEFQKINDKMNWGFRGKYRYFRSHALRKYHASNIGLPSEYIDALQGRSKTTVHEAYIKTNPQKLKEIYLKALHNVEINSSEIYNEIIPESKEEQINITINIFVADTQLNLY